MAGSGISQQQNQKTGIQSKSATDGEARLSGTENRAEWVESVSKSAQEERKNSGADPLKPVRDGDLFVRPKESGIHVAALQELLNGAGATPKLSVDGKFGSGTEAAVREFQRSHKLKVDGVVGSSTLTALEKEATPRGVLDSIIDFAQSFGSFDSAPTEARQDKIADNATFKAALKHTLRFEGGVSRDIRDPGNRGGNATNMGIIQTTLNSWTASHGKPPQLTTQLSAETIEQIYHERYWLAGKCNRLPETIAAIHFDTCVNMGVGAATRFLQKALGVEADGVLGPRTVAALAAADQDALLKSYCDLRERAYINLAKSEKYAGFLTGWMNRLNALRQFYDIPDAQGKRVWSPISLTSTTMPIDYGVPPFDAIKTFQSKNGIKADGIIGRDTFELLIAE